MKQFIYKSSLFLIIIVLILGGCSKDSGRRAREQQSEDIPKAPLLRNATTKSYLKDSYIIVFKDDLTDVDGEVKSICNNMSVKAEFIYKHALKGFAAQLPSAAVEALRNNPRIKYIEQNQEAHSVDTQVTPPSWGLDRVDQYILPLNSSYVYNLTGQGVDAYIFDTGILLSHTDFGGRAVTGFDAITPGGTANDGNGHGTHVAGTVGGSTYGIAKKVNLIAVRVLDDSGNGTYAQVIAGLDWADSNHTTKPAVGNMSLDGPASTVLDDAVRAVIADGIVICVASGNDYANASAYSPADVPEAITVAATDKYDVFASFSNSGSLVDILAPGVNITSDWNTSNSATNTISGTSMAAPHVTGAAALYLEANPTALPAKVESDLKSYATSGVIYNVPLGTPNLMVYSLMSSLPSAIPGIPVQSTPGDGSVGIAKIPALTWKPTLGAVSYTVQVSTTSTFTSFVYNTSGITSTTVNITGLAANTKYYWRLNAANSFGTSNWSNVWGFTTLTIPGVPVLSSPANSSTGIAINPILTWNPSSGADSYVVQVSASSTFSTFIYNSSGIKSTSVSITGLAIATKYYWRVCATNSAGNSSWTSAWSFTTLTKPSAPVLSSPASSSTRISTSPTLTWKTSVGADSYAVQVSTSSTFSSFIYNQTGITSTSVNIPGLTAYTKYYWRVNATNIAGTGSWTSAWSFTTLAIPSAPVPKSPANSSTGIGTNPSVSWNSSSGAVSYALQVSTSSDFSSIFYSANGIISTSASLNGLANGTKYYWRINATNSAGTSSWSSTWSFTTISAGILPQVPVESLPANAATSISINPALSWYSSSGADSYTLQVSANADFSSVIYNLAGLTSTSANLSGLANLTKYYWRLSATNSAGTSNWSNVWSFTTIQGTVPSSPSLSSPANGATNVAIPVTLVWLPSAGAASYILQVSTASGFSSYIVNTTVAGTSFLVSNLLNSTKYYWRVSAVNSTGTSKPSSARSFTTAK